MNFELSTEEGKASVDCLGCCIFAPNSKNHCGCSFLGMLGLLGEPSWRAGEVDPRVEILDLSLDRVEGIGGRNPMDDNLVPDFILPKTSCCRHGGSNGFLNGRAMRLEDREGRSIVFGNELDVMVGSELYGGNKRLLNCRVNGITDGEVVGIVWECCAISLNDNSTVAFGQNRRHCLLSCWEGSGWGSRCSGSLLGPSNGREWCNRSGWGGSGGSGSRLLALLLLL